MQHNLERNNNSSLPPNRRGGRQSQQQNNRPIPSQQQPVNSHSQQSENQLPQNQQPVNPHSSEQRGGRRGGRNGGGGRSNRNNNNNSNHYNNYSNNRSQSTSSSYRPVTHQNNSHSNSHYQPIPGSDDFIRPAMMQEPPENESGFQSQSGSQSQSESQSYQPKNRPRSTEQPYNQKPPQSSGYNKNQKLENITGFAPNPIANNNLDSSTEKKREPPPRRQKPNIKTLIKGQSELTQRMMTEIINNTYECMVCVDKIRYKAAIWSCKYCYQLFHIGCVRKWRNSCLAQDPTEWKCPHCRRMYKEDPRASCFCNKSPDAPPEDYYLLAHSCGEICGKLRLGTNCPHSCSLQCHPGPCPECPALAPEKNCFCGKTTYRKRCGQEDSGKSCGNTCDKLLLCKRHDCEENCHAGPCPPCTEKMSQRCYCGKVDEYRTCGSETFIDTASGSERHFSCGQKCGRKLQCGNHICEAICHPSNSPHELQCGECPVSPAKILTCACGKTPITEFKPRKSCLDPIPICKNLCGKFLRCGKHTCTLPCHLGPCIQECQELVTVPCRCGESNTTLNNAQKIMKCQDVYPDKYDQLVKSNLCKKTCGAKKECGLHSCNIKCCPVNKKHNDPEGIHVCRLPCPKKLNCGVHKCPLTCHRGKCPQPCLEIVGNDDRVCPCGLTIQEAPIICGSQLPQCRHPCVKQRECGHPMTPHLCHWAGDCPSCVYLESKRCACGAKVINSIPCWNKDVTCGTECGKPLHCGRHKCTRKCHTGPCEEAPGDVSQLLPDEEDQNPTISCGQPCRNRLEDCFHFCKMKCHPGKRCPTGVCKQKTKISCACGRLSDEIPCIGKKTKVELPCDDICKKEARSRQLAIAFGFLPSGTKPPTYTDFLLNIGRALPRFLLNLETKLNSFVRSGSTETRYRFPDPIHRKIIHELAKYYFLDESVSQDPQKVVHLVKKNGSRIPTVPLSQMSAYIDAASTAQPTKPSSLPVNVPQTVMHIYDISPRIKTSHLEYFLESFLGEYVLHWIDETNALVIFRSESLLRRALNELSGREFKIKSYNDSHPEPDGSGFLVLNSTPLAPPATKKPAAPTNPYEYRTTTKPAKPKVPAQNIINPVITGINQTNSFELLGEIGSNKNDEEAEEEDSDEQQEDWGGVISSEGIKNSDDVPEEGGVISQQPIEKVETDSKEHHNNSKPDEISVPIERPISWEDE